MVCPCCGKDALDNEMRTKLKQLCEINGINGELANPGGRQLRFSTTGEEWCQIMDYCVHCDYTTVENFINQRKEKQ